jgi:hypothetical protein
MKLLTYYVSEAITNPNKVLMYKGFRDAMDETSVPKSSPMTLAEFIVYVFSKGKWETYGSVLDRQVSLVTLGTLRCLVVTPHDEFSPKVLVGIDLDR